MRTEYQHIIWDWNGTLLNDVDLAIRVVNDILVEHQLEVLHRERYREIFDFPVQLYYERAGMDFSETSFDSVSARFCEMFETNIGTAHLFGDVEESLAKISHAGIEQYLLSATEHESLLRMVTGFGIAPTFKAIKGMPDGLARDKTSIGQDLVRNHDIDPSRSLIVGDTTHDWEISQSLGIDCVLVSTGHHSHDRLSSMGCPVFTSVAELIDDLYAP